ncbi:MAG: hypothetical protein JWP89_1357 [Schlesneria sp.]|nr:hypothetical protein [Schlesneria sp.]
MRFLRVLLYILSIAFVAGCGESIGERKQPIAMDKVPAEILKVAQEKYPEFVFDTAFTEIEDGQSVYELKGKAKSGKIIEVEVTKDGKILK